MKDETAYRLDQFGITMEMLYERNLEEADKPDIISSLLRNIPHS